MKTLSQQVLTAAPSELVGIIGQLAEALTEALNRSGRKEFEGIRSDVGYYFRPLVGEYLTATGATPEHISELLSELIGGGATVLEDLREGYRLTEWEELTHAAAIAKRIANNTPAS